MSEAVAIDDAPEDDRDPFAEVAEEHPDALRRYADSDLNGAWVAKAILNASSQEGE